jgi:hypothetical protein
MMPVTSNALGALATRRAVPHGPLPRLRGRDRERGREHCLATMPSPHPSPDERVFTPVFDGLCGRGSRQHPRHAEWLRSFVRHGRAHKAGGST